MANTNNSKILYIFFVLDNNNLQDFNIMSQSNKVIYIADIAYKTRFVLLANVFIV